MVFRVVRETISMPEDLYKKINEYGRRLNDVPNFMQMLLRLIRKGL